MFHNSRYLFRIILAKFNETIVPVLNGLETNYNLEELRQYETTCLKLLEYRLQYYTAYDCLMLFLSNGIIYSNETEIDFINLQEVYNKCLTMLNSFVYDSRSINYTSIQIATSIICLTRHMLNIKLSTQFTSIYECNNMNKCYELLKM